MSAFFLFCASSASSSNSGYSTAGNRLALTDTVGLSRTVHNYTRNAANRVVNVDGVDYTWDANPLRYAARTSPPCFTSGTSWESPERRGAHLHL
jgi:hypothetical protein